ncbi:Glycosyltransferase 2-like domain-containing protein [Tumidithrix helvetica PCC 7403]|uniref:glycosyltransferase family 2 protein n=1 Tax=Tumidithrix helvetica TaxID=3457545 RepID=UPI003C967443
MLITVIVPTYRRPKDLERCLSALSQQTRQADRVIAIVRDTDMETQEFLASFQTGNLPLTLGYVHVAGVVAAMNVGLDLVTHQAPDNNDIVAFTDDDAAPHSNWLERIEAHFLSDPQIGGVGGRDWVYFNEHLESGASEIVGKVQWFGRVIGNHHIGIGKPREVDVLKGVNMSFRYQAIANLRFDRRMRGTGAQVNFEIAFSLAIRQAGWKLIYDPAVSVNHYPAQRFDEDKRSNFNETTHTNMAHNETLGLLNYLPIPQKIVFLFWAILIGTRSNFGVLQWLRFLPKDENAGKKLVASILGRWQGWKTWQQPSDLTHNDDGALSI